MLKKIISLSLMLMLLSTFMIVAHADAPVMGISTVEADPGESVNVTVYIQNNPGISGTKFYVRRDLSLTLTGYAVGNVIGDGGTGVTATDLANELFLVSLSELTGSSNDGTLATLTYTVPNDATPGTTLPLTLEWVRGTKRGNITATDTTKLYSIDKNGNVTNAGGFTFVNGGITVKGTPAPTTYTLTYDAGAGSNAPAAETGITAGTEISLAGKTATAPAGKVFAGWTANGTDIITSIVVNDNVTLTAVYEDEPVAEKLLKGVITRQADSVAIDNANKTVNVEYDLKQIKVKSNYVMFAPSVDEDTEVDMGAFSYLNKFATTEYTLSNASAAGINLAAETGKPSVQAYAINKAAANSQTFTMTLTKGEDVEEYTVTLTIRDFATAKAGTFGITEDMIKTNRDDIVSVEGKVISITTKNRYNWDALAIKGSEFGPVENRQRPILEVLNLDADAKVIDDSDANYGNAVLLYYGANRSYTIRVYGDDDCLSYEDYTLNVNYVPTSGNDVIKIWRVHTLKNASVNAADDINTREAIIINSKATGGNISFYPILIKGFSGEFKDVGEAAIVAQEYNGREMKKVIVDPSEVPSDMKFIVKYLRDTRAYDVTFDVQ